MNRECQRVLCHNIGTKVRVLMTVAGEDRIEDIYLCRNCVIEQNLINNKSN